MSEIVQVAVALVGALLLASAVLTAANAMSRRGDREYAARRHRDDLRALGRDLARNPSTRCLYWCPTCQRAMWGKPGWHTNDYGMLCFQPLEPLDE